ncbi:MAG: hypothetical protein LAO78_24390 [Acidobacteriia bacterium]|nr:hypothetical protein [Terriglobia bacterium]
MADFKFTSQDRKEVYRLIVLLNSSLQFIVLRLEELAAAKILNSSYLTEMKTLTQKVQTSMDAIMSPAPKAPDPIEPLTNDPDQ